MSDVSGNTSNQQETQAKRERWTAIVSTLVAIVILTAGVTASQRRSTSSKVDEVVQWEEDLRFQIHSVYRHDARARDKRLAKVDTVMHNWEASKQTTEDRAALLEWLTDATVRSMPGSVAPLAPLPEFDNTEAPQLVVVPAYKYDSTATPKTKQPDLEAPTLTASSNPAQPTAETGAAETPVTPTPQPDIFDTVELHQPRSVNRPGTFAQGPVPTLAPPPTVAGTEQPEHSRELVSFSKDETALKPVTPEAEVHVNLTELAARIAGYHDALDQVELALLRTEQPTTQLLKENLEQLDMLSADYQFVTLYFSTLSDEEKQGILEPRSLEPTLAEVARHLEYVEKNSGDDYLDLFKQSENGELTELKTRLEKLQMSLTGN